MRLLKTFLISALIALPLSASAQGTNIAFGNVKQDTSGPVEVAADNMTVNQNTGSATLTGNVLVGQGAMRLSANVVNVIYSTDGTEIKELKASGKVTLVSGQDAAEAANATYNVNTGLITLSGNVLLVQGTTAITADKMRVDTKSGTARMEGRVKTVLNVKN